MKKVVPLFEQSDHVKAFLVEEKTSGSGYISSRSVDSVFITPLFFLMPE